MDAELKKALHLGLADALGFVLGAIAGWQLGLRLGFDFVNNPDWGGPQIFGLLLIVAGCGAGRWFFRSLLARITR